MSFAKYTEAILSALEFNPKANEAIARKQEILNGVYSLENLNPSSILFVGFNPAILSTSAKRVAVTEVTTTVLDYLKDKNPKIEYIPFDSLADQKKQFQCVIAMDEYFTFADSDLDQQIKIKNICTLATNFVISTVRDYKNQDFKEREFSQPALIRNGDKSRLYLEYHNWDIKDRTLWNSTVHEIHAPDNQLTVYGPFARRTMYFKQLAKFSLDFGAANFFVHKNLMYKSLIKKNYEHVVSIQFD